MGIYGMDTGARLGGGVWGQVIQCRRAFVNEFVERSESLIFRHYIALLNIIIIMIIWNEYINATVSWGVSFRG